MARMTRNERIGLTAMSSMAVVALLFAGYGHVGLGFLLFMAAATPLPMLAAIRARRSRGEDGTVQDEEPV